VTSNPGGVTILEIEEGFGAAPASVAFDASAAKAKDRSPRRRRKGKEEKRKNICPKGHTGLCQGYRTLID